MWVSSFSLMEKQTFTIDNTSCGHCVATIKIEIREFDGVTTVEGDPVDKSISVDPVWRNGQEES